MAETFPLIRYGKLLLCNAVVAGPSGVYNVPLLLDTGSNYTVLPVEVLEAIGCNPAASHDHVRIVTGNGVIMAPRVRSKFLSIFNLRVHNPELIAHDLPFAGPIQGLLGMDILRAFGARIDVAGAEITLASFSSSRR